MGSQEAEEIKMWTASVNLNPSQALILLMGMLFCLVMSGIAIDDSDINLRNRSNSMKRLNEIVLWSLWIKLTGNLIYFHLSMSSSSDLGEKYINIWPFKVHSFL